MDDAISFSDLCEELGENPVDHRNALEEFEALQAIVRLAENNPSRIGWAVFSAHMMGSGRIPPGQALAQTFGGPVEIVR